VERVTLPDLISEPDIEGFFTRDQAPGAIENGSRVVKVAATDGDAHPIGAEATVLGSVGPLPWQGASVFGYFVLWDAHPHHAVFCVGSKLDVLRSKLKETT
jgi:hypothetical protein